jgi:radical SAM protein with 4Fe4S-binding SPASM domain
MKKEMQQPLELEAFFERMNSLHIKFKKSWFSQTEIKLHRALNFLVSEKSACNCYQPYKCSAGRSLVTILPNGDLLPFRRMPILIGNVFNKNIEELYEHSVLLRMLRKNNIPYQECKSCHRWDECNGGLRCLSYAYHGNPFSSDPQCFKIYSTLPEN